jgi:hypothetical protein
MAKPLGSQQGSSLLDSPLVLLFPAVCRVALCSARSVSGFLQSHSCFPLVLEQVLLLQRVPKIDLPQTDLSAAGPSNPGVPTFSPTPPTSTFWCQEVRSVLILDISTEFLLD